MVEFYEGTLDTLKERLCSSISSFDPEWIKSCVPATEEQIQQLQDILAEYHLRVPAAYLHYLRGMGQNDGGLLESEWGGCEPDINTILEELDGVGGDLEEGFFLFSYHWAECYSYLKLSSMDENPIVVDMNRNYFAGSFEKYLFQKAFHMYQEKFEHSVSKRNSVCNEKKEKEYCSLCPLYGNTMEERMDFVNRTAKAYGVKKAWFSDRMHFFCYDSDYALEVNVSDGHKVKFSCNDDKLLEQAKQELDKISFGFIPRSGTA